jgi:hypothetical protein
MVVSSITSTHVISLRKVDCFRLEGVLWHPLFLYSEAKCRVQSVNAPICCRMEWTDWNLVLRNDRPDPDCAMFREKTSRPQRKSRQARGCLPFIVDIWPTIGSVAASICDRVIFTVKKEPWNEFHFTTALISGHEQYLLDYRIYADTLAKLNPCLHLYSECMHVPHWRNRSGTC